MAAANLADEGDALNSGDEAVPIFELPEPSTEKAEEEAQSAVPVAEFEEGEGVGGLPVYELEDFVVTTEEDRGYHSANALAGTRTNQALKDTPMTISVINQQLIQDLNLSTMDDIGATMPGVEEEGEVFSNNVLRLRGLQSRDQLYTFFPRSSALNFYNIERVEVIRGANSLVYGQASPGGKANVLPREALFENDKARLEAEHGEEDLFRATVDANYQLNEQIALRFMGVTHKSEFDQNYKRFEFDGATVAATYRPGRRTSFGLHLEYFNEVRNNPRPVEKDQTHQNGFTGILTDLPMTPDIVGLLSDQALDEIIHHEDRLQEYMDSNESDTATDNRISEHLNNRQLNIESAEDLKRFYSAFSHENIGSTSGPDNMRNNEGGYLLGTVTHQLTDDFSMKLGLAHESVNGDHLLRLGNTPQLSSRQGNPRNSSIEPNEGIEYNPDNATDNDMPHPFQRLYWRSQDVNNRIHALRTTFSWDTEVLGTKQQLLLGVDFDRKKSKTRAYDLIYDDAKVSDTGYWDPQARVQDYFLYNETDYKSHPMTRFNNVAEFSPGFNPSAVFWEFQLYRQFSNLDFSNLGAGETNPDIWPNARSREGDTGYFQLAEERDNKVDTTAVWLAAQGQYMSGRLNTLFGVRLDRIKLKSGITNYFLTRSDYVKDPVDNPHDDRVTGRDPLSSRTSENYTQASPTIGGLLWLNDHFAVFGNFAKSIQSPIGAQLDPDGKSIDPEIGTGYEGGLKFELLKGKISGQVATFLIRKKNDHLTRLTTAQLMTLYPQEQYPGVYVLNDNRYAFAPVGRQVGGITVESKGLEADIFFNPTARLSLSLGYAYTDASFKKTPGGIADGDKYPGFANHSANLIGRYSFYHKGPLRGWYVGGNQKYRSESYYNKLYADIDGDNVPDVTGDDARGYELWLDDHFETTVFVGWSGPLKKIPVLKKVPGQPRLNLQFTVNNLFDEVDLISTGLTARYTNGRRCSLRASLEF